MTTTDVLMKALKKYWWTKAVKTELISEYVDADGTYMGIPQPDLFRAQVFILATKSGVAVSKKWPQDWLSQTAQDLGPAIEA